jgi:hypothetical protein
VGMIGLRQRPEVIGPRWRPQKHAPFLRDSLYAARPAEGMLLFLGLFSAYVLLLALATLAQSPLLKAVANVLAVVIFGLLAFAWSTRPHPPSRWATAMVASGALYATGIVCSLIVNPDRILWGDLLKISLAPGFLVFGAAFERARAAAGEAPLWQHRSVKWMFALLVMVPILTLVAQVAQSGLEVSGVRETSIFANRNNAAVYVVTLVGLFKVIYVKRLRILWLVLLTILYVLLGVFFGTLGVLLAVLIALTLTVARLRELLLLALLIAAGVGAYQFFPEVGPFKRVAPVVDTMRLLSEGRINLRTVTYAELVVMLKTSDLSFVFRLKHWTDLWLIFSNGDVYNWLFGHGVGSSTWLSEEKLVPHNDYIRVGFEFGLVTLAAWGAMLWLIMVRCGRSWEAVPLMVVLIYLFSENLINNYVAMAFFYFSAGVIAERCGAMRAARRTAATAATAGIDASAATLSRQLR